MKNKGLSIALACAIGAGLGTMLAMDFGKFWLFGLLIGGIAGYFIYDFKEIISAVPNAIKYAKEKNIGPKTLFFRMMRWAKREYKIIFAIIVGLISVVATTFGFIACDTFFVHSSLAQADDGSRVMLGVFFQTMAIAFLVLSWIFQDGSMDENNVIRYMLPIRENMLPKFFGSYRYLLFAIALSGLIAIYVPIKMVLQCCSKILLGTLHFLGSFFWKFFKLIHSDLRLLVGIDSVIGGAVGFYFENMYVGMIVGALWALINYYIVSIRWLKLQPAPAFMRKNKK